MCTNFKKVTLLLAFIFIQIWGTVLLNCQADYGSDINRLTDSEKTKIEEFITNQKTKGKIPGLAVVIVKGDDTIYLNGFGFSDLKAQIPVSTKTLFELGSSSKAFTGLAFLQLHQKRLLSLQEPVSKYLPWLKMKYNGKDVDPTLEQFLYQTSGIPFRSINDIPESNDKNALERTVRTLVGDELLFSPGTRFSYATINYDVLGLIIQKTTGMPFEDYIKTKILKPLGLNNTYLYREEALRHGMAKGYKIFFNNPKEYQAPEYRGNTPAGYFITNVEDLAIWLKIQMTSITPPGFDMELIKESHEPDVKSGSTYAAGWNIHGVKEENGENKIYIFHGGGNPNFSSSLLFFPEKKLGVAAVANIRSNFLDVIPKGIMNIMEGKEPRGANEDENLGVDYLSRVIVIVSVVIVLIALFFIILLTGQLKRKNRKFSGFRFKSIGIALIPTVVLLALLYIIYNIPDFLFYGLTWNFVIIWGPGSLPYAVGCMVLAGILIYVWILLKIFFPKDKSRVIPAQN